MIFFFKPMESKREGDSIQENQKLQACAGVSWLFIIGNVRKGAWSGREQQVLALHVEVAMALYVEAAKLCSTDTVGTAAGSDLHFKQTISPAANSKKTSPEADPWKA